MPKVNITADDLHWFEPVFHAWNCNDMEGVLDSLETAIAYFMPSPVDSASHCMCDACMDGKLHESDCAVHNGPALPVGTCDCRVAILERPVVVGDANDRSAAKTYLRDWTPDHVQDYVSNLESAAKSACDELRYAAARTSKSRGDRKAQYLRASENLSAALESMVRGKS